MKKSRIITRNLCILIFGLLFSGCTAYHLRKGNEGYQSMAYKDAIDHYEKVLEKKEDPGIQIKLANSYREANMTRKAEEAYARVIELPEAKPIHRKHYANMLRANGNFQKAKKQYQIYLKEHPEDENALVGLHSCDSVTIFKRDSFMYTVKKVEMPGKGSVFSPVIHRNGVVFASEDSRKKNPRINPWTGRPYLDLYFAELEGPSLSTPQPLSKRLNSKYHDGPATFNPKGDVIYFTRSNLEGNIAASSTKGENNLMLFKAEKVDGKWKNIEKLPFNDDDFSTGHPALTPDGKTLIFISDRPGGFGGTDLYMSHLEDGEWTTPENLGPTVNSSGDEMFPSLGYTGDEARLYFASNGLPGLGGLDIYFSVWNSPLSKPRHLSFPINTNGDDFGLMLFRGTKDGFFSSNRSNEDGIDHLYKFTTHEQSFLVAGLVVDADSKNPIGSANIVLKEKGTQREKATITAENGRFGFDLQKGKEYLITSDHPDYMSDSVELSTMGQRKSKTYQVRMELKRLPFEAPIAVGPVYYDFDKYNIRPDAAEGLDQLAKVLKNKPRIEIELSSHCDSRGSDKYNMWLSRKRARSAVEYLVDKGIDRERLTPKWYGERRLVNHCKDGVKCSPAEHQKNRRTEFQVVGVQKDGGLTTFTE